MLKKLTKINISLALTILLIVPFHALLSVWLNSVFGHYVLMRLIEEYILAVMLIIGTVILIKDFKNQKELFKDKLIILIIAYLIVLLLCAVAGHLNSLVNIKATIYGLLLDSRYLIYFLLFYQSLYLAKRLKLKEITDIKRIIMIPAFMVISFGLLQVFVLPYNFLSHLGYSKDTILAYQTVNHNLKYIRIISTLRGANPLGAYMIFPISFIFINIIKNKKSVINYFYLLASFLVLYFSYCRSAVLGLALSIIIIFYLQLKNRRSRKILEISTFCILIIGIIFFFSFRNNSYIQNILFHTQKNSSNKSTSDQGHSSALQNGLNYIYHHPLGGGVGSAGQASTYNNHPAIISENYFLQIGEETGIIGLIFFVSILITILLRLYDNRYNEFNILMLGITSGIIIVSMLWFALSDETICFILFGLLAYSLSENRLKVIK